LNKTQTLFTSCTNSHKSTMSNTARRCGIRCCSGGGVPLLFTWIKRLFFHQSFTATSLIFLGCLHVVVSGYILGRNSLCIGQHSNGSCLENGCQAQGNILDHLVEFGKPFQNIVPYLSCYSLLSPIREGNQLDILLAQAVKGELRKPISSTTSFHPFVDDNMI